MKNKLKVYLSPPSSSKEERIEKSSLILETLKELKHEVLSSSLIRTDLKSLYGKSRKNSKYLPLLGLIFFQEEYKSINAADVLIVELTENSAIDGYLISYALADKKPVLALFYKDAKEKVPAFPETIFSENLYLRHYSEDNVKVVLRDFLEEVVRKRKQKGKLVVIEGSDGAGKKTQSNLLLSFLEKNGYRTKFIDFPRYYSSFHGQVIGRYLAGEFGDIKDVNPYLASLCYALDRLTAKPEIDDWLEEGNIVVSNRYTPSNMAHMSAKMSQEKRESFLEWLEELEYKIHKLPREDVVIYLYVPYEIGQGLLERKNQRRYLKGKKKDIHERSVEYMRESEKMYLWLVEKKKHWVKIDCVNKKGKLRTKKSIHMEIIEILQKKGIVSE